MIDLMFGHPTKEGIGRLLAQRGPVNEKTRPKGEIKNTDARGRDSSIRTPDPFSYLRPGTRFLHLIAHSATLEGVIEHAFMVQ